MSPTNNPEIRNSEFDFWLPEEEIRLKLLKKQLFARYCHAKELRLKAMAEMADLRAQIAKCVEALQDSEDDLSRIEREIRNKNRDLRKWIEERSLTPRTSQGSQLQRAEGLQPLNQPLQERPQQPEAALKNPKKNHSQLSEDPEILSRIARLAIDKTAQYDLWKENHPSN
ncbi:hypothetical protein ACHAPU_007691 [Fusarium lateritium]